MSDASLSESSGSRAGLWIRRGVTLGVGIAILAGTGVIFGAMQAAAPKPEEKEDVVEALPVLTAYAERASANLQVRSQGEVTARSRVQLAAEVGGRVSYVAPGFLPGGAFSKGDVLLKVDSRDYELGVTQAEASVAQAKTALKRERSEAEIARINASELGISDVSELALREPQVAEAEAALAAAEARLAEARLRLERTTLRAPFTGRVKTKTVDVGAFISAGASLGEIFSSGVVEVPLAFTDADLSKLDVGIGFEADRTNQGPEVRFTSVIGGTQHEWTGRLTRMDAGFDPQTRVLFGYAEVKDPYGSGADDGTPFATGLFVTAHIDGRALEDVVKIPRAALRGTEDVFVVRDDNSLEIVKVDVASSDREEAIILAGLDSGDRVVTSPVRGAATGMIVKPVEAIATGNGDAPVVAIAETIEMEE